MELLPQKVTAYKPQRTKLEEREKSLESFNISDLTEKKIIIFKNTDTLNNQQLFHTLFGGSLGISFSEGGGFGSGCGVAFKFDF